MRFRAAVVAEFSVVFAATGALFIPIYFQEVLGYSPMRTGVSLLPVSLVSVVVSPNTGKLIRAFGARKVLLSGMVSSTVGLISLGLLESQPYWAIVGPLVLLGYGFASVLTVAADLVLMSAPHERAGAATGVSETSFELGSALGIALIGSAITAIYQARLSIPAGVGEQVSASVTGVGDGRGRCSRQPGRPGAGRGAADERRERLQRGPDNRLGGCRPPAGRRDVVGAAQHPRRQQDPCGRAARAAIAPGAAASYRGAHESAAATTGPAPRDVPWAVRAP